MLLSCDQLHCRNAVISTSPSRSPNTRCLEPLHALCLCLTKHHYCCSQTPCVKSAEYVRLCNTRAPGRYGCKFTFLAIQDTWTAECRCRPQRLQQQRSSALAVHVQSETNLCTMRQWDSSTPKLCSFTSGQLLSSYFTCNNHSTASSAPMQHAKVALHSA